MESKDQKPAIGVFAEARMNQYNYRGYYAYRHRVPWESKTHCYCFFMIRWGLDHVPQYFPVKNTSNTMRRGIRFGVGHGFFELRYYRRNEFINRFNLSNSFWLRLMQLFF